MKKRNDGFGVVMVLGVLLIVGTLGLALGIALEGGARGSGRTVLRSAGYYLAEGIVERLIGERLSPDSDWSDVPADTIYNQVALDRGVCTLVASNPSADAVDVVAESRLGDAVTTLRLRIRRIGGVPRWERLGAPFVVAREEG